MYMYAWEKGCKTTYYLRSRPATRINKTTIRTPSAGASAVANAANVASAAVAANQATVAGMALNTPVETAAPAKEYTNEEIIACSIDNPEACEACQ